MTHLFNFAKCKNGYLIPICPSTPLIPDVDPQPTGEDGSPVIAACIECGHVAEFRAEELQSYPTSQEFSLTAPTQPSIISAEPAMRCGRLQSSTISACTAEPEYHRASFANRIPPLDMGRLDVSRTTETRGPATALTARPS